MAFSFRDANISAVWKWKPPQLFRPFSVTASEQFRIGLNCDVWTGVIFQEGIYHIVPAKRAKKTKTQKNANQSSAEGRRWISGPMDLKCRRPIPLCCARTNVGFNFPLTWVWKKIRPIQVPCRSADHPSSNVQWTRLSTFFFLLPPFSFFSLPCLFFLIFHFILYFPPPLGFFHQESEKWYTSSNDPTLRFLLYQFQYSCFYDISCIRAFIFQTIPGSALIDIFIYYDSPPPSN